MNLEVVGKNLDISDALTQRARERIANLVRKYAAEQFDSLDGRVTFEIERTNYRAQCLLHRGSEAPILTQADGADAYVCFDLAAERLEKRLRRLAKRSRRLLKSRREYPELAASGNRLRSTVYRIPEDPASDAPSTEETPSANDFSPVIVSEGMASIQTLSVADAVAELDVTGSSALVFRHAGNGGVSVVFRRHDGHIGWIDTRAENPKVNPGKTAYADVADATQGANPE